MRDLLFKRILPPRNEIIWNNQNIIIDGKAPFYKSWLGKKTFYGLKISSTTTVIYFLSIFSLKIFTSKHPSLFITV